MAINLFSPRAPEPSPFETKELALLYQQGRLEDAEAKARILTSKFPNHAMGWTILAAIFRVRHENEKALPFLKKVVDLSPNDPKGQFNLANALRDLNRPVEAISHYQRALKIQPDLPNGFFHLGCMQHEAGLLPQAERSFRKALAFTPGHIEALSNLAHVLQDMGRTHEALENYDAALILQPDSSILHYNRSDALQQLGRFSEAENATRSAIKRDPLMAEAHIQLGNILEEMGQLEAALTAYREAIRLAPNNTNYQSNLLFILNYLPSTDRKICLEQARAYGSLTKNLAGEKKLEWKGNSNPSALRIGLVSADFRNHPVGHFLESILRHIDPKKIELIALSTQKFEDGLTKRIRPFFREWHSLAGLSDTAANQSIQSIAPHVLLDLSGHTAGNRLPLFAYRLAPVQATWLGYFATTGVVEMDYLIADSYTLPHENEDDFSETIWRLPDTRLCFTAPREQIAVNPSPALSEGSVTLGSFSNLAKLNDDVIALWSRILHCLPASRLLQAKQLRSPETRVALINRFAYYGINSDQLILEEPVERNLYLKNYHRVDFCLDPFPFPGGTTTAESLWMGVPVLTLQGERFVSRQGSGLLTAVGLTDWIASSVDDYHARAIRFAQDIPLLAKIRQQLRDQALASPIFDAPRFARNIEAAFWAMWEQKTKANALSSRHPAAH
jgi:predicted O-linked N-acetylglucosamine transferase (SPINDLY family)